MAHKKEPYHGRNEHQLKRQAWRRGHSEFRTPTGVKDNVHEEASSLAAEAKEACASAVEKTKEAASSVVHRMGDMASTIGHKTEGAVDSVGGEMKSLAGTIRDNAPKGGVFGSAASGVASTLESGGAICRSTTFTAWRETRQP